MHMYTRMYGRTDIYMYICMHTYIGMAAVVGTLTTQVALFESGHPAL